MVTYQNSVVTLDNLKLLISNIADSQADEISKNSKSEPNCELKLDEVAGKILSLQLFEALDKVAAEKEINVLSEVLKKITSEDVLVEDQAIKKPVPIPYEVLKLIFLQTSEKFRQNNFYELMNFYYEKLTDALKKFGSKYYLKKAKFEFQVKYLLPLVKFETLLQIVDTEQDQQQITDLASNIRNYFNNPRMNQEDIYVIVKNNIGSLQFHLVSYQFIPLDQRNGFLGDYFHLKIDFFHENVQKKLNLFAKFLTPKQEAFKEVLKLGPSKKEEFFYMIYFPKLEELGYGELTSFAPNCYFSRVDDVLILDDMTQKGFISLTPNMKLEYETLKLAIGKIAKLHCCSLILEQKVPSLCDTYDEFLQEVLFRPDDNKFIPLTTDRILYLATRFPEITKNYTREQLKEKLEKGFKMFTEKIQKSSKIKNVVCHGDLYVANMLFKFDQDQTCEDVALIDFQILRYCPPTVDLMFFLYQTTFKETLEVHKESLLEEYYATLTETLTKHGFNPEEIYSKEEFCEAVKYAKNLGIIQALFYSPGHMVDPKVRESMLQDSDAYATIRAEEHGLLKLGMQSEDYRRALGGLLEKFIEICDNGEI
ncbi:unnamed protein product [Ceutorhynchus assimilis]|uniref:CHK kinase-like domain-containing protein n=1 Tax=Ceutorhynchus assimilis TaxID=467358 RepID=A0A9N9QF09_9CUCU|nr:unnamed protein product [Ceutorhynchus assimilis]